MLSKAAKNDIIEHYSAVFKANPSVLLVEYKGLSVKEIEGLRSNLKDADTRLAVVKNTLLKKAAKDTDFEQLTDFLVGPTAIAVCESDAAAAAKVFVNTAKDIPALVIKGGLVEGAVVGAEEITAISKLPSRQEMMAQLLGALTSPMSNLVGTLSQLQTHLLYALEALKDQKEAVPEAKEEPKEETKTEAAKENKSEVTEEKPKEDKVEEKAEAEEAPEEAKADSEEPSEPEAKAVEESEAVVKEEATEETQEASEAEPDEAVEQETSAEAEAEESTEEEKEES